MGHKPFPTVIEPADTSTLPLGLWEKIKADPQYAPEHLTMEAVTRLGPQARVWVDHTRAHYPYIHADALAQMAIRKFTNRARLSGAISGITGLPGAVVDIGVLAWTQASMVLHIAAAYGIDPTDQERATELLVLQRVHKYAEGARVALGVASGQERISRLLSHDNMRIGRVIIRLGFRLGQMAGVRVVKRLFAKIVPGASIILGTWANSAATKSLARRAVGVYRPRAFPSYPSLPTMNSYGQEGIPGDNPMTPRA